MAFFIEKLSEGVIFKAKTFSSYSSVRVGILY
jgi:hypothetical protein